MLADGALQQRDQALMSQMQAQQALAEYYSTEIILRRETRR
jgi:hypothetical protein